MRSIMKFIVPAALVLACAACSHSQSPGSSAPAGVAPAGSVAAVVPHAPAIPMKPATATSSGVANAAPADGPTLAKMLRRPAFAHAFAAMDGASALPAWAKQGNGSAPTQRVVVAGKPMLLAQVCETQACQGGEMLLLIDPADHVLQGVLVQSSGDAGASVHQLAWLGKPDAAAQAFLQGRLAPQ